MWFAASEKDSYFTLKIVNTAAEPLKLSIVVRFGLSIPVLSRFTREQPLLQSFALNELTQNVQSKTISYTG